MLLDSNIIIYAAKPEHADLRRLIAEHAPAVSAVSVVEVLGYHRLTAPERQHFEEFSPPRPCCLCPKSWWDRRSNSARSGRCRSGTRWSPQPHWCMAACSSPAIPRTSSGWQVYVCTTRLQLRHRLNGRFVFGTTESSS